MKGFKGLSERTKKTLGKKGAPLSIKAAGALTNPNWYRTSPKDFSYHQNCQRCVVAYELLRRGYMITASKLPDLKDDLLYGLTELFSSVDYSTKRSKKGLEDWIIKNNTKGYGRYAIGVEWDEGGGHWFNIELKNGRIVSIDSELNARGIYTHYMEQVKPNSKIEIYRLDNAVFSNQVRKVFKKI